MTSHDAVALIRAGLRTRKVGHLGTLDPAAAGVLPLSVGRATRLFDFVAGGGKSYRAEITFGITTDTLDADGLVMGADDCSTLTRVALLDLLPRFVGEIEQIPPAFSAVQVEGKRLHSLARKGEAPTVKARKVRVHSIDLVGFWPGPRARSLVDVVCETGTYIRVLAADLGAAIGCGAYLSFLLRTRSGRFELQDSLTLEECQAAYDQGDPTSRVLPIDWPLQHLAPVELDAANARRFGQGTPALSEEQPAEAVRVYGPSRQLLGIGAVSEGHLRPRVVVAGAEEAEP